MSFTNYLENALLLHVFGSTAYARPTNRYLGLFTAAPSDAGGGTEVSGGGYARVATGDLTVSGTDPTLATNAAALEFPVATANWGTVTHFAVFDAPSGGNMLAHGALTTARTINTDDVLRVRAGELDITLD